MGSYNGTDYREILIPDDLSQCNTQQRRAYIWRRVEEEGHESLIDKDLIARKLDISRRQVYYDLEAVAEFVEEEIVPEHHTGKNMTVFEKAKREALRSGEWEQAIDTLMKQSEWLENRGALDKEPEEVEVTWREFVEEGKNTPVNEKSEVEVEAVSDTE